MFSGQKLGQADSRQIVVVQVGLGLRMAPASFEACWEARMRALGWVGSLRKSHGHQQETGPVALGTWGAPFSVACRWEGQGGG